MKIGIIQIYPMKSDTGESFGHWYSVKALKIQDTIIVL
jgi:hypothetical protein